MSTGLPTEIHEQIVVHLTTDARALRTCALICRAWTPLAQRALFWDIELRRLAAAALLVDALERNPQLGAYVRRITFSLTGGVTFAKTADGRKVYAVDLMRRIGVSLPLVELVGLFTEDIYSYWDFTDAFRLFTSADSFLFENFRFPHGGRFFQYLFSDHSVKRLCIKNCLLANFSYFDPEFSKTNQKQPSTASLEQLELIGDEWKFDCLFVFKGLLALSGNSIRLRILSFPDGYDYNRSQTIVQPLATAGQFLEHLNLGSLASLLFIENANVLGTMKRLRTFWLTIETGPDSTHDVDVLPTLLAQLPTRTLERVQIKLLKSQHLRTIPWSEIATALHPDLFSRLIILTIIDGRGIGAEGNSIGSYLNHPPPAYRVQVEDTLLSQDDEILAWQAVTGSSFPPVRNYRS